MKLISMTDFVFLMRENKDKDNIRRFWTCEKYAKFLKQPLELWMFVPCDEEGNILLDTCKQCNDNCKCLDRIKYQQAKERCLFEGFRLEGKYLRLKDYLFAISTDMKSNIEDFGDIEKLIYHYLSSDIELTQTAIKQLVL